MDDIEAMDEEYYREVVNQLADLQYTLLKWQVRDMRRETNPSRGDPLGYPGRQGVPNNLTLEDFKKRAYDTMLSIATELGKRIGDREVEEKKEEIILSRRVRIKK